MSPHSTSWHQSVKCQCVSEWVGVTCVEGIERTAVKYINCWSVPQQSLKEYLVELGTDGRKLMGVDEELLAGRKKSRATMKSAAAPSSGGPGPAAASRGGAPVSQEDFQTPARGRKSAPAPKTAAAKKRGRSGSGGSPAADDQSPPATPASKKTRTDKTPPTKAKSPASKPPKSPKRAKLDYRDTADFATHVKFFRFALRRNVVTFLRKSHDPRLHAETTGAVNKKGESEYFEKLFTKEHMESANALMSAVDRAKKSGGVTPLDFLARIAEHYELGEELVPAKYHAVRFAWTRYDRRMRRNNSMDFNDVLMHCLRVLSGGEEVRAFISARFKYLLVDEFQDTTGVQLGIVRQLIDGQRLADASLKQGARVTCVGDDDQLIMSFAGSRTETFGDFARLFGEDHANDASTSATANSKKAPPRKGGGSSPRPPASGPGVLQRVSLVQNYRCTQKILDVAACALERNAKPLVAAAPWKADAEKVGLWECGNTEDEAAQVAKEIRAIKARDLDCKWSDLCVLMRNFKKGSGKTYDELEEAFSDVHSYPIPYRVMGGRTLFERRFVVDLHAYLNLVLNRHDDLAFLNCLNEPPRGLGPTFMEKLKTERERIPASSLFRALHRLAYGGREVGGAVVQSSGTADEGALVLAAGEGAFHEQEMVSEAEWEIYQQYKDETLKTDERWTTPAYESGARDFIAVIYSAQWYCLTGKKELKTKEEGGGDDDLESQDLAQLFEEAGAASSAKRPAAKKRVRSSTPPAKTGGSSSRGASSPSTPPRTSSTGGGAVAPPPVEDVLRFLCEATNFQKTSSHVLKGTRGAKGLKKKEEESEESSSSSDEDEEDEEQQAKRSMPSVIGTTRKAAKQKRVKSDQQRFADNLNKLFSFAETFSQNTAGWAEDDAGLGGLSAKAKKSFSQRLGGADAVRSLSGCLKIFESIGTLDSSTDESNAPMAFFAKSAKKRGRGAASFPSPYSASPTHLPHDIFCLHGKWDLEKR